MDILIKRLFHCFYHIGNHASFFCIALFNDGDNISHGNCYAVAWFVVKEAVGLNVKRFGNIYENWQTQFSVACLDMTHVRGGDPNSFRQFFLG